MQEIQYPSSLLYAIFLFTSWRLQHSNKNPNHPFSLRKLRWMPEQLTPGIQRCTMVGQPSYNSRSRLLNIIHPSRSSLMPQITFSQSYSRNKTQNHHKDSTMVSQELVDWEVFVAAVVNELKSSPIFMVLMVWRGTGSERSTLHQWGEERGIIEEHFDF